MDVSLEEEADFCKQFYAQHIVPLVGYFNIDEALWVRYCHYPFSHHKATKWTYLSTTVDTYDFNTKQEFGEIAHSIRETFALNDVAACFAVPILGYLDVNRDLWFSLFGHAPLYIYHRINGLKGIQDCIRIYTNEKRRRGELAALRFIEEKRRKDERLREQERQQLLAQWKGPLDLDDSPHYDNIPGFTWSNFSYVKGKPLPWMDDVMIDVNTDYPAPINNSYL